MKHTRQDLKIMQGWSLEEKIKVSQMKNIGVVQGVQRAGLYQLFGW